MNTITSTKIQATTVDDAIETILNIYHQEDLCFQELFASLMFPNMEAENIIKTYARLSQEIDGDQLILHRSNGDSEIL